MLQSRTHTCNELRSTNIGEKVVLSGWYENIRKVSKNLGFLLLRDCNRNRRNDAGHRRCEQ